VREVKEVVHKYIKTLFQAGIKIGWWGGCKTCFIWGGVGKEKQLGLIGVVTCLFMILGVNIRKSEQAYQKN